MGGHAAVGDDLGQLLVGGAHHGVLAVADLPAVHDTVIASYCLGLADEDVGISNAAVRFGMDAGLAIRSAFTALPLDRLGEPITDELAALVARRLELTRYLVGVGLALPRRHCRSHR